MQGKRRLKNRKIDKGVCCQLLGPVIAVTLQAKGPLLFGEAAPPKSLPPSLSYPLVAFDPLLFEYLPLLIVWRRRR